MPILTSDVGLPHSGPELCILGRPRDRSPRLLGIAVRQRLQRTITLWEAGHDPSSSTMHPTLDGLLRSGTPHHLDKIVQPEMAGKGRLDLVRIELEVLLRRHDGLIQGQANHRAAQQALGHPLFTRLTQRNRPQTASPWPGAVRRAKRPGSASDPGRAGPRPWLWRHSRGSQP